MVLDSGFDPGETSPPCFLATSYLVTVTAAGGTGPYTYQWALVSGTNSMTISDAAAAAVRWTRYRCTSIVRTAVWRCTVTDSLGAIASVDVTVNL